MHKLVGVLAQEMGNAYPELPANRFTIETKILAEEVRFKAVLTGGLPRLEAEIAKVVGTRSKVLSGDAAFRLYDTFGVPFEFIEDTAATQGVMVDRDAYERAMGGQRDKARAGSAFGKDDDSSAFSFESENERRRVGSIGDRFDGYASVSTEDARIVALFDEKRRQVSELTEGQAGYVALEKTPFYLEAGGQVSDTGRLIGLSGTAEATVDGVFRIKKTAGLTPAVSGVARAGATSSGYAPVFVWPRVHSVHVKSGALHTEDLVTAEVDADVRNATRRNHTATHLLHAALRQVLGGHVKQAGSLVAPDRLRFDFVHFQAVTRDEQTRIEQIVNEQVRANTAVETEVRSTEEAIASGATALFGEKYGDKVRVVSIPGFSKELCGGTHVSATGDIGFFVIVGESGVAAGVRRIEALTGAGAVQWAQQQRAALGRLVDALDVNEDQAVDAIDKLKADHKRLTREVTQLKTKLAMGGSQSAGDDTVEVAGVRLARRKVEGLDKDALRQLADSLKAQIKSGVVVIASTNDGKVQIVVAVTADLIQRVKAGQIVKEIAPIVGGSGGGRPDFAEAGGKQPGKIDEMLQASEAVLARLLAT